MQGVFAGDFEIMGPLAEGGMGAVYVARQISTGKRRALKIMQPDLVADPRARERFALEATIASRIESEHVVEVVAAGIDDRTGTPWLAMELLEGQDLAAHLRQRGCLPPAEVLDVFRQLGHALSAAHRQGIVHRDVKPENVFIARTKRVDAASLVKVLDFGIAKLTQERLGQTKRTQAVGSPMWMAPEQADGTTAPTPAADVWALGLMAFQALTGKHYWRAANDPEPRIPVLFAEMLTQPIAPASVRAAELGAAGMLPPAFDGWFGLCVARDPAQRFRDATPAIAALEGVLAPPTQARRDQMMAPTMAASGPAEVPRAIGTAPTAAMSATPMPMPAPPPRTPPTMATPMPMAAPMTAPMSAWTPPAARPNATPYAMPHAAPPPRRALWPFVLLALGALVGVGGVGLVVLAVMLAPPSTETVAARLPPPVTTAAPPAPVALAPVDVAPVTAVPVPEPVLGVATTEAAPDDATDAPGEAASEDFVWDDGATVTLRGRCAYPTHDYTYTFTLRRTGDAVSGSGGCTVRHAQAGTGLEPGMTAHWTLSGSRTATTLDLVDNEGCHYDLRVHSDGRVSGSTNSGGRLTGRFVR